jgi:hypothetical protein
MADQSAVETALVNLISAVLYPQGTAAPSVLNTLCRVYRGWPHTGSLDKDLAAGALNVTVFPDPHRLSVTTRYSADGQVYAPTQPSYTISADAFSVTIGGTPGAGQVVGVLVDDIAVVHRTGATDQPALVAAILAADLTNYRMALVSGATITVPGAGRIIGRAVADQTLISENRRQRQLFRVTLWCPSPALRDAAAAAIDAALAAVQFIALPDGTSGRLLFHGSIVFDQAENAALYRRDLHYTVEYATTLAAVLPTMIFGDASFAVAHTDGASGAAYFAAAQSFIG